MPGTAWTRVILAGPGALLGAVLIVLAMPLWVPGGAAGIDNLVVPMIIFPLVWAVLFFAALLDRNLTRIGAIIILLAVSHGAALVWQLGP